MKTYHAPLCRRVVIAFLTAGVLGLVYSPTPAQAVEREGTTLFFSLEELRDALRFSPFSLFSPGTMLY